MSRLRLLALGAGLTALGVGIWKRRELGVELRMLGVTLKEGVLPDKAVYPYSPLPYQRLAAELTSRKSFLYEQVILGLPTLTFVEQVSRNSGINPAWMFVRIQAEQSGWTISVDEAARLRQTPKTWVEKYATQRDPATGGVTQFTSQSFTQTALDFKLRWLLGFGALEGGFFMPQFAGVEKQISNAARRSAELWKRSSEDHAAGRRRAIDCQTWNPPTGCTEIVPATVADRVALYYTPRSSALFATRKLYEQWVPEAVRT